MVEDRYMAKTYKENLRHRLNIIRGHLDKIIEMVETERYCMDILQQSAAVGSALKEAEQVILERHLKTCVTEAIKKEKNLDDKVEEVIKVFRARK